MTAQKARFATSVSMNEEDMARQQKIKGIGISIIDTLRKGQETILSEKKSENIVDTQDNQE
jgi:hypothetical protein